MAEKMLKKICIVIQRDFVQSVVVSIAVTLGIMAL